MLDPTDLVLSAIDVAGGRIEGRTRLQKLCYFVSELLGVDADYRPHYYGPYSSAVSAAVDGLVQRGGLREDVIAWGQAGTAGHDVARRLYRYELTDYGREILERRRQLAPRDYASARDVVRVLVETTDDYKLLSYAAKLYLMLLQEDRPLTLSAARKYAGQLGWDMNEAEMRKGADILRQVGLVG